MRAIGWPVAAIVLWFAASAAPTWAVSRLPPRQRSQQPAASAVIRGRVLGADTRLPLRRALVTVTNSSIREPRLIYTDDQGRYEIKELSAGRYALSVSKAGYLTVAYGQTRASQLGQWVELKDGEIAERIDISLPHGGVITGRVLDELGEPVANAQVVLLRPEFVAGHRSLAPGGRITSTNDLGEFRLFGLWPGQHYLLATNNLSGIGALGDRLAYMPTYYPGTARAADARPVALAEGQELANVAIPLILARTARVSGVALDSAGRPMAGSVVQLLTWQPGSFGGSPAGRIAPDGTFTLANLRPGDYLIATRPASQFEEETAHATVRINGEDIDGLLLVGQRLTTVRGTVIFDDADQPTIAANIPAVHGALQVQALRAAPDESVLLGPSTAPVGDNWLFELKTLPGPTIIRLGTLGTINGWQLKAVRLDGRDVTDDGLDLRNDREVDGLEIVLTSRVSQVSGAAFDTRNQAVRDYTVVIFPEDSRQWNFQSRYLAQAGADPGGLFKVTGLPPGRYLAIALDDVEPGAPTNAEFLEAVRPRATPFTLSEGQIKTLDLPLRQAP